MHCVTFKSYKGKDLQKKKKTYLQNSKNSQQALADDDNRDHVTEKEHDGFADYAKTKRNLGYGGSPDDCQKLNKDKIILFSMLS